jgi:integrase
MAEEKRRVVKRLNAAFVRTAAAGFWPDGDGLYLRVDDKGNRRWVFVSQKAGKRREMGLGSARTVSLADARTLAHEARKAVHDGRDPIAERQTVAKAKSAPVTFGAAASALLEARAPEWRNEKHAAQWAMTLEVYGKSLWALPVQNVDTPAILEALKPLWQTRPETASRLRGRIEAVLDYARAKGELPHDRANPAAWKGHLAHLLPKRGKLTRGHHSAMPWREVPDFVARLRERETVAARSLEFLVLTASRTGEVLGARWDEIDFEAKTWTVPAHRMKAAREHRVALSARAIAILEKMASARTSAFVFPGQKPGRSLSAVIFWLTMRRMGEHDATVHGFRSAFRDWVGDETHFPRELAEAALAHVIGDKAEQAYRRGDALEKRRELMQAWASFCEPGKPSNIVALTRHGRPT